MEHTGYRRVALVVGVLWGLGPGAARAQGLFVSPEVAAQRSWTSAGWDATWVVSLGDARALALPFAPQAEAGVALTLPLVLVPHLDGAALAVPVRARWPLLVPPLSAADHEQMDYKALQLLLNGKLTRSHCDPTHPPPMPVWRPGAHVEYLRGQPMGSAGFTGGRFEFDFAAGLDTFRPRVLLVGSECSGLGADFQERWHRPLFRDAQVVRIAGAGHRLIVERPDAVLAALEGYLEEYVPR